jgi:hypothetical protein
MSAVFLCLVAYIITGVFAVVHTQKSVSSISSNPVPLSQGTMTMVFLFDFAAIRGIICLLIYLGAKIV